MVQSYFLSSKPALGLTKRILALFFFLLFAMILLWLAHTVKKLGLYSPSIAVLLGQIRNTFPVAKYQHSKHWKIIHIPSLVTQILENKFLVKWNQNKSCPSRGLRKITYHHINYGVIQGFPALRKTITTHVKKKTKFFHMCLITSISCLLITCFLFHLLRLINEWQSFHHSQSKVICWNFLGLWLLKH